MFHLARTFSANGVKSVSKNCAQMRCVLEELESKLLGIKLHPKVSDALAAILDVGLDLLDDLLLEPIAEHTYICPIFRASNFVSIKSLLPTVDTDLSS